MPRRSIAHTITHHSATKAIAHASDATYGPASGVIQRASPSVYSHCCAPVAGSRICISSEPAYAAMALTPKRRPIGGQPKQPRARVAALRERRKRAALHKAEAKLQHRVRNLGILIEARRESDWIGKPQAKSRDS